MIHPLRLLDMHIVEDFHGTGRIPVCMATYSVQQQAGLINF